MSNQLFLTVDEVIDRLEITPSQISPTTIPLNTGGVSGFLRDGEAQITSVLTQAGLGFGALEDTDLDALRFAVLEYAVAQSLAVMGQRGTPRQTQAWTQWKEALARYTGRAALLKTRSTSRTLSNGSSTAAKFSGRNYEF